MECSFSTITSGVKKPEYAVYDAGLFLDPSDEPHASIACCRKDSSLMTASNVILTLTSW